MILSKLLLPQAISLEEYRQSSRLSYSSIKDCFYNPTSLFSTSQKISTFMNIGSAVDLLLTDPDKSDLITIINTLPGKYLDVVPYILETYPNITNLEQLEDEQILDIYKHSSYEANWGIEVKKQRLLTGLNEYFVAIQQNPDAIILTPDLKKQVDELEMSIKTHPKTSFLFQKNKNVTIIPQYKVFTSFRDADYKGMMDFVVINEEQRTIQLLDLKIGNNTFMSSFLQFKWFYQGVLYQCLFEELLMDLVTTTTTELLQYRLLPFKFIYVHTSNKIPYIYEIPVELHNSLLHYGINQGFYRIPSLIETHNAAVFYIQEYNIKSSIQDIELYESHKNNGVIPITALYNTPYF